MFKYLIRTLTVYFLRYLDILSALVYDSPIPLPPTALHLQNTPSPFGIPPSPFGIPLSGFIYFK